MANAFAAAVEAAELNDCIAQNLRDDCMLGGAAAKVVDGVGDGAAARLPVRAHRAAGAARGSSMCPKLAPMWMYGGGAVAARRVALQEWAGGSPPPPSGGGGVDGAPVCAPVSLPCLYTEGALQGQVAAARLAARQRGARRAAGAGGGSRSRCGGLAPVCAGLGSTGGGVLEAGESPSRPSPMSQRETFVPS